jgi:hypothetical protein
MVNETLFAFNYFHQAKNFFQKYVTIYIFVPFIILKGYFLQSLCRNTASDIPFFGAAFKNTPKLPPSG